VLWLLLTFASAGCVARPPQPTEPPIHGEPLSGSLHMTSDPPLAPYPLTIRIDDIGGPSRLNAEFDEGEAVVVDWPTLPLPQVKWIEVNGHDCEGTFEIQARLETDLLLTLRQDACRVEVIGSHPEGAIHHGDEPGSLMANLPIGARLRIQPVDPGANTRVRFEDADEAGVVHVDFLPPGRYEIALIVDDRVQRTVEVHLVPGGEVFLTLVP
jgi:hypothetical protein